MARITLKQWCDDNGIEYTMNAKGTGIALALSPQLQQTLEDLVIDSVCPALCDEGCEVEPDGRCEHDCPSILLACGLI